MRHAWLVLVGFGALVGVLVWGRSPTASTDQTTSSARMIANAWYRVYFTRPHRNETPADRTGGIDAALIVDLDNADQRIDLASFDFDLRSITDALKRARKRGVAIRMVIDGENVEKPLVAALLGELQKAGIPITFDRRAAFMHNKFIVVDGKVVWTGSWNLTINDTFRNNNNVVRIASPTLAVNYSAKFEALFKGRGGPGNAVTLPNKDLAFGSIHVRNAFSPDAAITTELVRRVAKAQRTIDILAFTITSDPLTDAVIAAQKRGVRVRAVLETRNAKAGTSSFGQLQGAKIDVHMDGNCYTMHDKVFVIDGQTVITGSFNWTKAAQEQNDENVLIIDDPTLAAHYTAEFGRIYAQALRPDRC